MPQLRIFWVQVQVQALALVAILLTTGCFFDSDPPKTTPQLRFDYLVQVGPKGSSDCEVTIKLHDSSSPKPILFQAPKFYADNPAFPVPGIFANQLMVNDANGQSLKAKDTVLPDLNLDGNFILIPQGWRSISYRVDLDPKNPDQFGIPIPGTAPGVDLIDGAYFFLLPLVGNDFASQWRTEVNIHLEFLPAPGRFLVGSDPKVNFQNNYGLMFVRAAYDPVATHALAIPGHEVVFYSTRIDSVDYPRLKLLIEKCMGMVEDSLQILPTYRYFIGENSVFWGVEGSQGYWFKAEGAYLPALHIHELVHTFVGIYSGDIQDPWYKEGLTNYLGNLLSLQAGLLPESTFTKETIWSGDTIPAINHFALSSPNLRNLLFTPLDTGYHDQVNAENYLQLVYGKGSQASMILDRYILENSQRQFSVYDLVRDLNQHYPFGFMRQDLVQLINGYARKNSEAFLHELLDSVGAIPLDSLKATYLALKKMGRFSPGVPPEAGLMVKPVRVAQSAKVVKIAKAAKSSSAVLTLR